MAKVKERALQLDMKCDMCKQVKILMVNGTDYTNWARGELAQVSFPYLTRAERELIISATCDDCWNKLWGRVEDGR